MQNCFLAVNDQTGFVVGVFVGSPAVSGLTFVPRTVETRHVREGYRLVDGEFVDARDGYDPASKFAGVS